MVEIVYFPKLCCGFPVKWWNDNGPTRYTCRARNCPKKDP